MSQPMYEWNALPWRQLDRRVFKLQTRIYRASRRGDVKAVHKLQRLLLKSWSARCLAVRRVAQENRGKKTAGVDGVKDLTPTQRRELVRLLRWPHRAHPVRRVWLPKPGTTERRPLGIPTMADRAAQALAKLALEPEWEAHFEPNSYGFRPGRSCHDAVQAIFQSICFKDKYVLDADIAKCFDRINHQALLRKLHTFPTLRRAIRAWLKAGVMDGPELFPTTEGTPQGGVLSPLLANVALHGLETVLMRAFPWEYQGQSWKPTVVRYADDFVVLHPERRAVERAQQIASAWLADMGLELKPTKTRIAHTLRDEQGRPGFDFLGFHVRQYSVGKTHAARSGGKNRATVRLGFKTIIKPSKESQRRHLQALAEIIDSHKAAPQAALIHRLNPVIRGWANYFSTRCSAAVFSKMAHLLYCKLHRWAVRRHHKKSWDWVARKYWHTNQGKWTFATPTGVTLYGHQQTHIRRHVKVQGARSPYDGDWSYWATRFGKHPELPTRVATLLKRQRGACAWCGLYFKVDDLPEVDHIIPTSRGGDDAYRNWQLLHRHCHDQKTATDGSVAVKRGARDQSQIAEEPDEPKGSRPVLETSRPGD
jgi:RNA-directed DNA polymerase